MRKAVFKIGLVGGRGYVGETLLTLLSEHPTLAPAWVASRSLAGQAVDEVYPTLGTGLRFVALEPAALASESNAADVIVLALPNGLAAAYVAALASQQRVLDLSADYRFDADWCYGLPEHNRRAIAKARRISNPGCYATAAQLALAPIVTQLAAPPSLFGVSGFSGAGRTPSERNDPERLRDNLLPYALAGHLHEREVSHQLGRPVRLMPHVAPFFRGISMTVAATLDAPATADELLAQFQSFYSGEALVRVTDTIPEVRAVTDTPSAQLGGFVVDQRDPRQIGVVACLDNLLKGAASQALQNLNLMLGLDELTGLNR